jgi:hypothetical protein
VEGQPPRSEEWERDLRARLMAGEAPALAEADEQFASMVHRLAARVLGDRSAADDVTQRAGRVSTSQSCSLRRWQALRVRVVRPAPVASGPHRPGPHRPGPRGPGPTAPGRASPGPAGAGSPGGGA